MLIYARIFPVRGWNPLRCAGDDRQLSLVFSAKDGEYCLLLSILGRRSNLYLLDAEEKIVQVLRPLSETRSDLALGGRYRDPEGAPPGEGADRFGSEVGIALLEAIGASYSGEVEERVQDEDQRRLNSAVKRERKSAQRRLEKIEAELAEADEASTLQRNGELLKGNLSRIDQGADSITVDDFETGEPVVIKLDPKLAPKANLEAIFKRYQKLLRRLTKAGGQVDTARTAVADLDLLAEEVAAASTATDRAALFDRADVQRILGRHTPKASSVSLSSVGDKPPLPASYRDKPRKLHPRRYVSSEGVEIWVGRSDEANDFLTTRLARSRDLFFHLDGAPGSHVILRNDGQGDPPPEAILDACELSVHFSKQKNAGRADVHVVPIKNVKKPKGAKRGLVYVTGGKSIHLRREAERLERLLASKIED